jgi:hypothetical protein
MPLAAPLMACSSPPSIGNRERVISRKITIRRSPVHELCRRRGLALPEAVSCGGMRRSVSPAWLAPASCHLHSSYMPCSSCSSQNGRTWRWGKDDPRSDRRRIGQLEAVTSAGMTSTTPSQAARFFLVPCRKIKPPRHRRPGPIDRASIGMLGGEDPRPAD